MTKPRYIGGLRVRDALDFDCPFCDGKGTASLEHYMVTHTLPPCAGYLALDPPAYLQAVNEAERQKRAN